MKVLSKILEYGIPVYIFLLPWQARWIFVEYSTDFPLYGDWSLYVIDAVFSILLIAWVVWVWKMRKARKIQLSKKQKMFLMISFLFVAFTAISSFWAPNTIISAHAWDRIIQAWFVIMMIATAPVKTRLLFVAVIGAAAMQGLVALQQFLLQAINPSTIWGVSGQQPADLGVSVIHFQDQRWLRAYGTLPHPNMLGALCAIAGLAASLWYFQIYKRLSSQIESIKKAIVSVPKKKMALEVLASFGAFSFIIIGLLLSFSRSAWLGFAVGWVFLLIAILRQSDVKERKFLLVAAFKQVLVGGLILLTLSLSYGPLWTSRVVDTSRVAEISISERAMLSEQAAKIVSDNWVIGTGIAGYLPAVMNRWPGQEIFSYQPVHNVWMLLWAELGVVGFVIFGAWVIFILWALRTIIKKELASFVSSDSLLTISVLFSIGIMAYYDHFWWTLPFGLMFVSVWLGIFIKQIKE